MASWINDLTGRRGGRPMTRRLGVERDIVIVACAVSAGIHGALVPDHLEESTASGLGFAVSTVLLAVLAVWLTLGSGKLALAAAAAVLAGLLVSYGLAITIGFPVLHPEPEPVDALALATKAIEVVGLAAVGHLLLSGRPRLALLTLRPKGTTT